MSLERLPGSVARISRGTSTAVAGQRRYGVGGFGSPSFNAAADTSSSRRLVGPVVLAAIAALLSPTAGGAAAADEQVAVIHLQPRMRATGSAIKLGEMADIIASSDDFGDRLAAVEISSLGAATLSMQIPQDEISRRLTSQGFSPAQLRIVGADVVSVSKSPRDVLSDQLRTVARQKLAQLWQVPEADVEVELTSPPPEAEPGHVLDHTVDVFFHERQQPGLMRVRAALSGDNRTSETIWVSLRATLYGDVVVATRPLPRGELITEDDVDAVRREVRRTNTLVPWEEIVGNVVRHPLRQGQAIRAYQVEARRVNNEYVIRPRDTVRLTARKAALTITVSDAEALQQGRIGDTIRVKNPRSKKIVVGRVISRNEVQVMF